ncbi:MAG: hypothetical protein IKG00_07280 [Lachnospiraceae bacterium]|nr:hypothetical protein [Solobacterium sp.]MBR3309675.1 hypothetical protein [Lachnospiraceae bacterium]
MEQGREKILVRDGDFLLKQSEGKFFIQDGERSYELLDYAFEPCLYIRKEGGFFITIHNSFSLNELCQAAETNGKITMISGDVYDMKGICMLLRKALTLAMDSVDLTYLEACCFLDHLKECGACSKESAVLPADWGIDNPNVMNSFLHSKKVSRTNDGRFYLKAPGEFSQGEENTDRFFRVISDQVRFGCGYRKVNDRIQYFAWHGVPSRNDDYITTSEISRTEFERIRQEYPKDISADRETAELFRNQYVEGHPVILEGWNRLL